MKTIDLEELDSYAKVTHCYIHLSKFYINKIVVMTVENSARLSITMEIPIAHRFYIREELNIKKLTSLL
jgi:hypothetical protein